MSKATTKKTDSSHFAEKVGLRLLALPDKKPINVLDCFAGNSYLWKKVKDLRKDLTINVLGIDRKKIDIAVLRGDNRRYLGGMDLNRFDLIDLDAYGIPFEQLDCLFKRKFKGTVVLTYIQSLYGALPMKLLKRLGYTRGMIKKCPTLFYRNGLGKLEEYLAKNGVKKIRLISIRRKHYLSFEMPKMLD